MYTKFGYAQASHELCDDVMPAHICDFWEIWESHSNVNGKSIRGKQKSLLSHCFSYVRICDHADKLDLLCYLLQYTAHLLVAFDESEFGIL